jgi:carbon-monoxide dehydrogenase large subunit
VTKYAIGQEVVREEDERLLKGKGRYVDDFALPQMAHSIVLRSPHAHADILSTDATAARAMPGVLCVLTGKEFKERGMGVMRPLHPRKKSDGSPAFVTPQPFLADGRVRYVGDPVAFVVAETLNQAKDAAEAIAVEYAPLPVVTTAADALAPGAPAIWPDNPGNEAFDHQVGDAAGVDAALKSAAHVVRYEVVLNRVTANSMEPRGCIAEYDEIDRRYTIRVTVQAAHNFRAALAELILKVPQSKVRVICDNMGGGFGMKGGFYPEYALSLWAAEITGRPVKWIGTRTEALLCDEQGRGAVADAELGLDADGKILALRIHARTAIGAYFTSDRNCNTTISGLGCLASTYTTPLIHARVTGVMTNTMMISQYRGGGRPEPMYMTETIIERAADQLGIDPLELRRRNTIGPEAMPYKTPMGQTYDCGNFLKNIEDCEALADYANVERRRAEARQRGKLLGVGVSNPVALAGGTAGGYEHAEVRFDPSGAVTLITGSMDHGQGHGTTFKQVLCDRLGIDAERVRYVYGDTDQVSIGFGTFGSRSAALGGSSVLSAADKIVERGRLIAAHQMEAAPEDVEFSDGKFTIAGTDRSMDLIEVAKSSFKQTSIPAGMDPGFDEQANLNLAVGGTFPNGSHICEVEIDEETGAVELTRYVAVDDVGVVLNPLLFHGQIMGGIAQGAGQAFLEHIAYSPEDGQHLSATFMDYCMPRADNFPLIKLDNNVVVTQNNPLGVKGAGEGGTVGALPAVMNAVNDALTHIGAPWVTMPATSEKTWQAISAAKS